MAPSEEFHRTLEAAEGGDPEAQMRVAEAYLFGLGVEADQSEGVRWTLRAAEAGHAKGLLEAGKFYGYGWGVPTDFDRARTCLEAAAAAGQPDGAEQLAFLYLGDAIDPAPEPNPEEAARWFAEALRLRTRAAEDGSAGDMARLAQAYEEGEPLVGGAPDPSAAAAWAERAWEAGEPEGGLVLARLLRAGRGVEADPSRARSILEELRDAGDAEAAFWLEDEDPTAEGAAQELLERARRNAGPSG